MEMVPGDGYFLTNSEQGFQDFSMVPDLKTIRLLPWQPGTAFVLCDAVSRDGTPIDAAPRNILKRQIARAARAGVSFKCASELEFFLFRNSYEEAWNSRYRELTPTSRYRADYNILQSARDVPFIGRLCEMMCSVGIEIENVKPEWGLGQQEITLKYAPALEMADRHLLYKAWVKELAAQHGLSATFMAKPFINEVGSSCHIHISLWDSAGTTPLGFDPAGTRHMSSTFGAFVAGLIAGGRSYAWMVAPSVNSYKRFRPNAFAPIRLDVGMDNRTCGFRIVGDEASFRVESRLPGADANPYLALAGTLASGLDGIDDGLPTPSLAHEDPPQDAAYARIPSSMGEAIGEFAASVRARASLGPEVHAHLLNFARDELAAFEQDTVTDWEMMRYFERI
ncbi:MAG: glutamine synthetase family protein [Sphingomonadaceae bacterium]